MGAGGEDILFSQKAGDMLGISVECKSRNTMAIYAFYSQAADNCPEGREPVVVVKQNYSKPLVVIDAEYYVKLLKGTNETLDNS
jgi:hypothetical protein